MGGCFANDDGSPHSLLASTKRPLWSVKNPSQDVSWKGSKGSWFVCVPSCDPAMRERGGFFLLMFCWLFTTIPSIQPALHIHLRLINVFK